MRILLQNASGSLSIDTPTDRTSAFMAARMLADMEDTTWVIGDSSIVPQGEAHESHDPMAVIFRLMDWNA